MNMLGHDLTRKETFYSKITRAYLIIMIKMYANISIHNCFYLNNQKSSKKISLNFIDHDHVEINKRNKAL